MRRAKRAGFGATGRRIPTRASPILVVLRDKHYAIDLKTWARYYFYVHRIMGYLLATFPAVGVAGLTK